MEVTDLTAGLGNTTALDDDVTVTFRAAPVAARVIPTVPATGPEDVLQLSARAVGFATRVTACRAPVHMVSASTARGTLDR